MPRVSIITPTYNRAKNLDRAIQSVLRQTYQDWELIIVDDGSHDDTALTVERYTDPRIKYIGLKINTGGSMIPRQVGMEKSAGEFIAVLDDDDYWYCDYKLESQVAFLDHNKEYVLVGTNAIGIYDDGRIAMKILYPETDESIRDRLLIRNCFFHSSVVYRRDTVLKTGSYKVISDGYYLNGCNEYDLWFRMGLIGKMANLPFYGVSLDFPMVKMQFKYRLSLLRIYLDMINEYKHYYPHKSLAYISAYAITLFELPFMIPMKKYFRRFAP